MMTLSWDAGPSPHPSGDRFLEWKAVKNLTGFSRTTAWRRQKAGDFPLPRQISPGRVGWLESEVSAWQASRAPSGQADLPAFEARPEGRLSAKTRGAPPPKPPLPAPARPAAPPSPVEPSPTARTPTPKRRSRRAIDAAQGAFDF